VGPESVQTSVCRAARAARELLRLAGDGQALEAMGEAAIPMGRIVRVPAERAFEERVEWPA